MQLLKVFNVQLASFQDMLFVDALLLADLVFFVNKKCSRVGISRRISDLKRLGEVGQLELVLHKGIQPQRHKSILTTKLPTIKEFYRFIAKPASAVAIASNSSSCFISARTFTRSLTILIICNLSLLP